jgi:hypothetical protein
MHSFREIPTPNADASRTHLNKTWGARDATAEQEAIKARLPAKRRKDAGLCTEYLITGSLEWFKTTPLKQKNAYFAAAEVAGGAAREEQRGVREHAAGRDQSAPGGLRGSADEG